MLRGEQWEANKVEVGTQDALAPRPRKERKEKRLLMSSSILKWFSVAALLLGLLLSVSASYRIGLEMAICGAAIVVIAQAVRIRKYAWATGLLVVSLLSNPALTIPFSHRLYMGVEWFSIAVILVSLEASRSVPRPSVFSITDRKPVHKEL